MTISFTLTREQLYLGIIGFFMLLQVLQWRSIKQLQNEKEKIWDQLGTLVAGISAQLISIQKDISKKEDKKAG